ncbi:MAG: flavoprotein [Rhodospirillaceae bacterium]|nr:flavoprotein [Magnetovibrio sp.]MAY65635.1 flavoprotein [Rhodospirillaceae bacterium]
MTAVSPFQSHLPVAIIGAGPVGLAAAAHLHERGLPFVVLEAGAEVGTAMREWGHVRLFSPWRYNVDKAARRLLEKAGWQMPALDELPTGADIVDRYLTPLADHKAIKPHLRLGARVVAIGRKDMDKVRSEGRETRPFEIRLADGSSLEAAAVIDVSGTWFSPNPMGVGGLTAPGEVECADRIAYGIPDVLDRERATYAGKRTLVVGSGHSAFNVLLDLLDMKDADPATEIVWAVRRDTGNKLFGGGAADALPARGLLGTRTREAVDAGHLTLLRPFSVRAVSQGTGGLVVDGALDGADHRVEVDRIVVATGFRPQLDMLREIRLGLDSWLEAVSDLAPLIDPNLHSCGTVRPHGAQELSHPESNFFIAGMKSYGRAPTFLMTTGYEQVRSIAAWLAGDKEAALRVELDLPETGVCSAPDTATETSCCDAPAPKEAAGCCGGPAPDDVDACCVDDAAAKAAGEEGCGCDTKATVDA